MSGYDAAAAVHPFQSVGVRIVNAAVPQYRVMRAPARNTRIVYLRQARLPDLMLGAGCSQAIACVTLH